LLRNQPADDGFTAPLWRTGQPDRAPVEVVSQRAGPNFPYGRAMSDRRFEDDRGRRRDRAGAGVGAAAGGTLGALLGLAAPLFGDVASAAAVGLAGAAAGGLLGRRLSMRLSLDEWDPDFPRRPYVGTQAPDDVPGTSEPPPRSGRTTA
jgi:hypothetical protein